MVSAYVNDHTLHLSQIREIGEKEFIIYFLDNEYRGNSDHFLVDSRIIWENFSFADWNDILGSINLEDGLIALSGFLYRNLRVDSIKMVSDHPSISEKSRSIIIDHFNKAKGYFALSRVQARVLQEKDLEFSDITEKLLKEGAPPATPIEPQYIDISDLLK